MRTTLVIDDDILTAAKAIARQKNQTVGKVISELARRSLQPPAAWPSAAWRVSKSSAARRIAS